MAGPRRFAILLSVLLALGLAVRIGYLAAQPAHDPTFDAPILDGAYYLDWARALVAGRPGPGGAYYLAPLYPMLLAGWLWLTGGSFATLYLLQHLATLATAALLGLCSRRIAGPWAGLATAALLLLYGPALFFAATPLGETVALLLVALALWALPRAPGGAGLATGLAALARPNLLAVGALWSAGELLSRRGRSALLVAAGIVVALLPVTLRNLAVSGHLVPVSGNMGITLYHGNGEGAAGVYTPPWHFGGTVASLREEATLQAGLQSGHELDAVEADRWWARQALRTRLRDPLGSVVLLGRKLRLLLANGELGLDYDPRLDRNPWRWGAPLPFALILGLAVAGAALRGLPAGDGRRVWSAVAGCALTPLIFYVSSRYRLPLAVLLCVPAGIGLAGLFTGGNRGASRRRRLLALLLGAACASASALIPTGVVGEESRAITLANRGALWISKGRPREAERDLRAALAEDPSLVREASVPALYHLGLLLSARGDLKAAERYYRMALAIDPTHVESAANLANILIKSGRAGEAVAPLRAALRSRPDLEEAWTNLVVALVALNDLPAARSAASEAADHGVKLDPELLRRIDREAR